jgi:hypothetical protein
MNDKRKFIEQYLVFHVLFDLAANNFIALSALSINTVYFLSLYKLGNSTFGMLTV